MGDNKIWANNGADGIALFVYCRPLCGGAPMMASSGVKMKILQKTGDNEAEKKDSEDDDWHVLVLW